MKTLQAQFDELVARQAWYGLSFQEKLNLLCNAGREYKEVAAQTVIAIKTHRKVNKQRSLAELKFNPAKRVRKTFSRLIGTVLLPQMAKGAAEAQSFLRLLGRNSPLTTAIGEVLSLPLHEVVWKMKEEAVYAAYQAFMAVSV